MWSLFLGGLFLIGEIEEGRTIEIGYEWDELDVEFWHKGNG